MTPALAARIKIANKPKGKRRLDSIDHAILLSLVQGVTVREIETKGQAIGQRIARMRRLMECRTTYQLVATYAIGQLIEGENA